MKVSEAREQFRTLYFAKLREVIHDPKTASQYAWPDKSDEAVRQTVEKMLVACQKGTANLHGSKALKWVAKKLGVTTIGGLAKLLTEDS